MCLCPEDSHIVRLPSISRQIDEAAALCPEAELRAGMSDADFWEHVLQPGGMPDYEPEIDDLAEITNQGQPCPECGQTGPCAYDADGRPMIHLTEDDET